MDPRIQYCVSRIEHKILHDSTEHSTHDALIQALAQEIRLSRFHLSRLQPTGGRRENRHPEHAVDSILGGAL